MENKGLEKVMNQLRKLTDNIKKVIKKGMSKESFLPENESYFRWKVRDFKYTVKGIQSSGAEGHFSTKKSWMRATTKIADKIKEGSEYKLALKSLKCAFARNERIDQDLNAFIGKVIHVNLHPEEREENSEKVIIERFVNDLLEKPVRCSAEIQLQGVILRQQKIEPAHGIIIRQPISNDLEKETPYYPPASANRFLLNLSAIANIEFFGRQVNEIQEKVEQMIVILRLFRVGSIKYLSYRMDSDSITDIMARGTLTSGKGDIALETSVIDKEDEPRLKIFWQVLDRVLPSSLYEPGRSNIDHINIAYDCYSDALMHNGLLERRIANTIMGIEALLLDSTQELSYKLGLRSAKVMSLLGDNPQEVRQIVKDAYFIRSLFSHGSRLSYRKKKKLEIRYGNIENILSSTLDYLRRTLVVMIIISKNKDELIDLIDNSLIDNKKESELKNLLDSLKEIGSK